MKKNIPREETWNLRIKAGCAAALVLALIVAAVVPRSYFGPLSARVRGLFVRHTRTGNPLVDSVAEHQPASPQAYLRYVHAMIYLAPVGFVISIPPWTPFNMVSDSKLFALLYSVTAYYFANRMMRLLILMGPVAAILGGISMSSLWTFARRRIAEVMNDEEPAPEESKKSSQKKKEE